MPEATAKPALRRAPLNEWRWLPFVEDFLMEMEWRLFVFDFDGVGVGGGIVDEKADDCGEEEEDGVTAASNKSSTLAQWLISLST